MILQWKITSILSKIKKQKNIERKYWGSLDVKKVKMNYDYNGEK